MMQKRWNKALWHSLKRYATNLQSFIIHRVECLLLNGGLPLSELAFVRKQKYFNIRVRRTVLLDSWQSLGMVDSDKQLVLTLFVPDSHIQFSFNAVTPLPASLTVNAAHTAEAVYTLRVMYDGGRRVRSGWPYAFGGIFWRFIQQLSYYRTWWNDSIFCETVGLKDVTRCFSNAIKIIMYSVKVC